MTSPAEDPLHLRVAGHTFEITERGLLVGSGSGCDVVLHDAAVATTHLHLRRDGTTTELSLLSADSATRLNGRVIEDGPHLIAHGDEIQVGAQRLSVVTQAVVLAIPQPVGAVAPRAGPRPAIGHPIGAQRLTIGRASTSDVVLDHPAVSAVHAELVRTKRGIRLRDLSSATSTLLNGSVTTGALLTDGDEIGIGHFRFRFADEALQEITTDESTTLRARRIALHTADQRSLLAHTSLDVRAGELVAIIGPSGSGKSTLLRCLAGVTTPTEGRVMLGGDDVALRRPEIGYVPQSDTVHDLLSPREGLRYAAALRLPDDTSEADLEGAVERALHEVGLQTRGDVRVGSLSGGERKRVAVALELISRPSLLLLDEPTTGLDPGLERRLMRLARKLADEGCGVVVVTHATRSLDLCDRVAVVAPGGRLVFVGAPADAPATFCVQTLDDVYLALDDPDRWPSHRADFPPVTAIVERSRPAPRRLVPQVTTLTTRYARLLSRDKRNLEFMAAQVAGLGMATALLFSANVFDRPSGGAPGHVSESAQLLFLMVTVAIWFGAIASARQIVSERPVLERELATGVRIESYLLSKAIVLGTLTAVQAVVFGLIVFGLRPVHHPSGAGTSIIVILVLTTWVGAAMGLLISALARSEDQATSLIPLALIPQLLFGGAIVPTEQMGLLMRSAAALFFSRWAFSGSGNAIDMNDRLSTLPAAGGGSRYGDEFFATGQFATQIILVIFLAGFSVALFWALRGEPSPRELYRRTRSKVAGLADPPSQMS